MSAPRAARLLAAISLIAVAGLFTGVSDATFTSATTSAVNQVTAAADWTAPVVTMTVPASPLTGTVIVTASADDPEGSATTVGIDAAPTGTSTWAQVCPPAPSPQSCSWETTTVTDGTYQVRATGTDSFGNTAEAAVTVTVTNPTA